jgi:hypothetical protein
MTAAEALALVQGAQSVFVGVVAAVKAMTHSSEPPQHDNGAPLTEADVDASIDRAEAPLDRILAKATAAVGE